MIERVTAVVWRTAREPAQSLADAARSGLLRRVVFGLVIGGVGGVVAHWAHVPLAFMLGSLFATMLASLAGAPIASTNRLRMAFLVLIGLFLGESFRAEDLGRLGDWPISIALSVAYVPIASWIAWRFYRDAAGLDSRTALFASIPGGLSGVVLLAGAMGADERQVTLSQSLRVAVVVLLAPLLFFGVLSAEQPPGPVVAMQSGLTLREALALGGATVASIWVFSRLGAPLPALIAPMCASALLRLSGVIEGDLPIWLVELALVVVGASLGCRFVGADLKLLARLAGWTLLGTLVMTLLSGVFAAAASALVGAPLLVTLLAFMPGGVAEMCIIALALDLDPSFVAAHHLARILFILLAVPLLGQQIVRALSREP